MAKKSRRNQRMAKKSKRKKPGPPARYGYRPTLTIRLQEPVYEAIRKAAAKHGKSLSEEIEDTLTACADLETARRQLEEMRETTTKMHRMAASVLRDANAERSAARVRALRAAGLVILREIEGRPTRVILDIETLLAEADGISRGLRSGFTTSEPMPEHKTVRPMTDEEARQAMDEIKRTIDEGIAAAAKSDDEAA